MKKNTILPVCITTMFFLFVQVANCQLLFSDNHNRYIIKTVNVENGLINNSVSDVVTDTFGFTWIATKTGFQRYDGYRLETIHPIINGRSLDINYQVHFFKTKNNFIWITYANGILQYNPYRDVFSTLISLSSSTSPLCPLRPLQETAEGIWCIEEKSFVLYNDKGQLIKQIKLRDSSVLPPLASARFQYTANAHYIFLITMQNQILSFDKTTGGYAFLPVKNEILYSLACTENKLYISHSKGITAINIAGHERAGKIEAFRAGKVDVGSIRVFHNQVLASINQHLVALDSNCRNISEITTLSSSPVLPAGFITNIYEDQFNRLWLLTNDDIKIVQNYTIPFQYYAYPNRNNFIKSIYVDEDKHLVFAGCFNGGIQLFDTLRHPLWTKPLMTDKVKDIAGIEKLTGDTYFIVTIGQGWYLLKLATKQFIRFPLSKQQEAELHTHNNSFPNNLQRADSNTILVTTATDVIQCRFSKGIFQDFRILFHTIGNNPINVFYLNQKDKCLWIGTSTGMLYCKQADGKINACHIPGNYQVRSLTSDAKNNIWAGTDKGLFVFTRGKVVTEFSVGNGLLNDCIYSLLTDDKRETIYASSNLGLSAIKLGGEIKNYTKEKGLQENEFNTSAIAKTSSGKLFFGGVNGTTAFYPSDIVVNNDHPSLVIYKTTVNDKAFTHPSAVWNTHRYNLSYNENKVSFSLAAFGLQNAASYTYEYKMEGFDQYKTTTNNPVNISYHLPAGNYTFMAKLVDFPDTTVTCRVVIAYPFWEQWWFYIIVAALVFLLLLLAARAVYQRRYKVKLQTLQIRQQVLAERERISRDLHDNIGAYASAISASVDDVIYQFDAPNPITLQRLQDSAREIIVQLRDSIWALNKENQTVIMLSDRIKNYIQKLQPTYPDIVFDVHEDIEQNTLFPSITALHVLRIVQEAVHNAIRHSGCSSVKINISSCSPVSISIEDDGCGMPGKPVYGDGLKNMQSRAAEIGWQVTIANGNKGCRILLRNTN